MHDGIDLYNLPNMQLIKTYSHGNANIAIFKVSFVDRSWLVSGGQDGFARLYNVQSGQLIQKLEHDSSRYFVHFDKISASDVFAPAGELVQTVTVSDF